MAYLYDGAGGVRNDLQAALAEPVLESLDPVGDGIGKGVELVEDGAGDVIVDDGGVPVHLVADGVDAGVEERAARLLAGSEVAYPGFDAVAGAEPEPDAFG